MSLIAMAAVGGGAWYLYTKRPKTSASDGRTTLTDASDSAVAGAGVMLVVAIVGWLLLMVNGLAVMGYRRFEPEEWRYLLFFDVAIAGYLAYWAWPKLRDVRVGGAGKLTLSAWPLREGETVEASYTRSLRGDPGRLRGASAQLVLYHTTRHGGKQRRERCHVVPLGPGGATLRDGRVEAAWTFEVPQPQGGVLNLAADLLTGHVGGTYEWRFEVATPLEAYRAAGSSFAVKLKSRLA